MMPYSFGISTTLRVAVHARKARTVKAPPAAQLSSGDCITMMWIIPPSDAVQPTASLSKRLLAVVLHYRRYTPKGSGRLRTQACLASGTQCPEERKNERRAAPANRS